MHKLVVILGHKGFYLVPIAILLVMAMLVVVIVFQMSLSAGNVDAFEFYGDIEAEATITVSWGCFLLQIYGENSEEVKMLRSLRDNLLRQTPEGREIIKLYYQWNPLIVKMVKEDEEFKEEVKELIDGFLLLSR